VKKKKRYVGGEIPPFSRSYASSVKAKKKTKKIKRKVASEILAFDLLNILKLTIEKKS